MLKNSINNKENMVALIRAFGRHLYKIIQEFKPTYLIPVETKGAILLELSLNSIQNQSSHDVTIIYPRAVNYLPQRELKSGRFLIVDDLVFSGKTLKQVYDSLINKDVLAERIRMAALLNFASGQGDVDYHDDICKMTKFLQDENVRVSKNEALSYIQNEIITERMPTTYDHLLIEGKNVNEHQYNDILGYTTKSNRLLNYFRRGAFFTGTIMLDDLYENGWDFSPKIRIWYKPDSELLRLAPIGSLNRNVIEDMQQSIPEVKQIKEIFMKSFDNNKSSDTKKLALFEINSLSTRLQMLPYIKYYLTKLEVESNLEDKHLQRYYPTFGNDLASIIRAYYSRIKECPLPMREQDNHEEILPFLSAAKSIIKILRDAYESQDIPRKDRNSKGYTGIELLNKLAQKHSSEEIHSAIDYCFDMNYISAFLERRDDGNYIRKARATENGANIDYHHGELYGAAVIYSDTRPTPAWLLNKVFPIIENTKGGNFDGLIVSKKGPFGDYSKVVMSESGEKIWKDIDTDLWDVNLNENEKVLKFIPKEGLESKIGQLMRDSRISSQRTPIDATLFLCKQYGRKGGILLNILTGQNGGTDYIAYNLEQIINEASSRYPNEEKIKKHQDGLTEKLSFLEDFYSIHEALLRRCTRLSSTHMVKAEADTIVSLAHMFPKENIYNVLRELSQIIIEIKDASLDDNHKKLSNNFQHLGVMLENPDNTKASIQLSRKQELLFNWLYALSNRECSTEHYEKYLPSEKNQFDWKPYILAYDLKSNRKDYAERIKVNVKVIDTYLNTLAQNWIIALGGELSHHYVSSGDLRYGFFTSFKDALQAACWMIYYSQQLTYTHRYFPTECPFGIGITRDVVTRDQLGNLSSKSMNASAHFLKGKLKERIDEVASKAGRKDKDLGQSNIHILYHSEFNCKNGDSPQLHSNEIEVEDEGIKYIITPLNIIAYLQTHPTPWSHMSK